MNKVAVVDSGLGGLAVLTRLVGALPAEYYYYADNAYMPYGNMNRHQLLDRASAIIQQLSVYDIDTVILACNTLSVATLPRLKYMYPDITIYGCEPPITQALQYTASQCVLVATQYVAQHTDSRPSLVTIALPQLASMIECGASTAEMYKYIEDALQCVEELDCIILGCTHYSHIKHIFHQLYPAVKVFDSVDGLVAHIRKHNKRNKTVASSTIQLLMSSKDEQLEQKYQQKIQQFSKYY